MLAGRPRDAIDRCYKNNESREEIATALEITPDGVKSILRRTRAILRDCIERRTRTSTNT
jgi:DNA-directed RNA polymerase specialized sigma24 family protein